MDNGELQGLRSLAQEWKERGTKEGYDMNLSSLNEHAVDVVYLNCAYDLNQFLARTSHGAQPAPESK